MMTVDVNEEDKIAKTNDRLVIEPDHRLLSPEELSAFLQVPVPTLYVWRYKGVGPPAHRVGRHLRYRADQVVEWLDGRRTAQSTAGE